jgi:transposase
MNEDGNTRGSKRYVALDIHKHYCVVAGVDRDGRVQLAPVRVEHADLEGWLKQKLCSTDHVVIESTTNAWHVYDLLEPLAERVVVANPIEVKQIANARVKTDIRDTLILARLLAAIWFRRCGYRLCMCVRCGSCCRSAGSWWKRIRRS